MNECMEGQKKMRASQCVENSELCQKRESMVRVNLFSNQL